MNRKTLKKLNRLAGPILLWMTRPFLTLLIRKKYDRRICILKIVGMGDTVLLLPIIHLLKKTLPDYRISAVVTPVTRPLFADNPDIDEIILYDILGADRGIWKFFP